MNNMPFKILSIDGGGLGGKFPASVLATLESQLGEPLYKYFDMMVGTSTGGIIAICLAMGISAGDVLKFYKTESPLIFKRLSTWKRLANQAMGRPLHDPTQLRASLTKVLGNKLIADAHTRLVVPATDARTGQVYVYKTAHHSKFMTDYRRGAVEAAAATSAAPILFPEFTNNDGLPLMDGMIWANNPLLVGITEAVAFLNRELGDLRVLSVGCVDADVSDSSTKRRKAGGYEKFMRLKDLFLKGQSLAAVNHTQLMIGKQNMVRIECSARSGAYGVDDHQETDDLYGEGARLGREFGPKVKALFFDCQAPVFKPQYSVDQA